MLTGHYDALGLHATGADLVFYLGLAQVLVAVVVGVSGGARWPIVGTVLIAVGETGQYFAGLAGALDLHLPLGVALVAGTVVLVVALWRTGALDRTAVTR